MKILNEYEMTRAYYALVELDDGRRVELKLYKNPDLKSAPSIEDWEAVATTIPADLPEPPPKEPTPTVEIYQDGDKIYG
jgi:hypothetical protein